MWKTIIKIGGALLSAFVTAILTSKDVQDLVTPFGFKIPIALITFLIFLTIIVVWIWGLENYKRQRERSKPRLVWFENHGHALYHKKPYEPTKEKDYIYHVLQIWFKNQAHLATEASVAEKVTAMVTSYDKTSKIVKSIPGCFIIAEALDYAGNTGINEEVIEKWAPNDEPHKLQIAIKRQQDDIAYGWGKGTDIGAKPIQKGSYYVRVDLKGIRVIDQQPFWFKLDNLGSGHELSLSNPIEQPDLSKEGFQT